MGFLIFLHFLKVVYNKAEGIRVLWINLRKLKEQYLLTNLKVSAIVNKNLIHQTVEAEITAMMPLQRACNAENQVRNKLSNGPLRAQSNVVFTKYSATLQADVICRGYAGILLSARVMP